MAYDADPSSIAWINERVQGAFATQLILDREAFSEVEFRLGNLKDLPANDSERRHAIRSLPRLDEQGDGIRSFGGALVALACTSRPIIMIDEPEAFLHPPQAYLMGRAIAQWKNEGAQIFVATHSAEVLQGMVGAQHLVHAKQESLD